MRISDWSSDVCSSDLAMAAQRVRRAGGVLEQQERDIPIALVVGGAIALLVPIGWLLHSLVAGGPLAGWTWLLVVGALVFVVVLGILVAAVCGYMAGLIGSSNSPISAVGILAILSAARSEEHTSELQSLMRISYAVFCLKK